MNNQLREIILQIVLEEYESRHQVASDKESFDRIIAEDYGMEVEPEAFEFYAECRNMGPSGFYLMYKDELDFSPEFKAEYGFEDEVKDLEEESLTEASETTSKEGSYRVQEIDSEGNKLDQFANFETAEEAIAFAKTLRTPAEVIDNSITESINEERVIWTNIDSLEEALSRDTMISELKAKGKNYNFNKYSDAQIYRMYEREMNKKVVKPSFTLADIDDEEDVEYIETSNCPYCNHQLTDAGQCPVCDLGDEEERNSHMLHLDETLFGRVDPEVFEFKIGDRVAERWNDAEFNVGTIIDVKEEEGTQYLVKWDYSDGPSEEWLYGDELTQWIEESITYPNGVEVRKDSVDLDKALDFMYGLDRLANDEYTEEEQQRAINYWIKKTDPSPYEESLNEEILNEGPLDRIKKKMARADSKRNSELDKLANPKTVGKILFSTYKDAGNSYLIDGKLMKSSDVLADLKKAIESLYEIDTSLTTISKDKLDPNLIKFIDAVVIDRNGYIIRRGLELIKPKTVEYNPNRLDALRIKNGFKSDDILERRPLDAASSSDDSDATKDADKVADSSSSEKPAEDKESTEPSKDVTDKTIQDTINAAKVFGMKVFGMQNGSIEELNDAQLKNLGANSNMDKIWVGKDKNSRVMLSQLANELKKKSIVESLDDEMECDSLEEKVITHDSLQDGDMEELLSLAKEIGINTMGELEQFAEREVPQGTSLLDTLKQYRDDLGDDFEVVEGFDGSPEINAEGLNDEFDNSSNVWY